MPRIPYVPSDELPDHYDVIEEKADKLPDGISSAFWNQQPTVLTFSNNPELGKAHVTMNTEFWTETGLSKPDVEIVILSIARAMDSLYEWHDHVIAGLERAGLPRKTILAISREDREAMDESTESLVAYATEYVEAVGDVSDDTYGAIAERYDDATIVGISMLAGFYVSLVHEIRALGIELEDEFIGWELENYDDRDA